MFIIDISRKLRNRIQTPKGVVVVKTAILKLKNFIVF